MSAADDSEPNALQTQELQRLRATVAQQQEVIAEMQNMARMGSWWRDLRTNQMHWSAGLLALLNIPQDFVVTPESVQRFAMPGESKRFWDTAQQAMQARQTHFQLDYRATGYTGRNVMLRVFAHVHYNAHGEPERVFGVSQDLTHELTVAALVQKSADLQKSEERLRVAVQTSGVAFWEWDAETEQVFWAASGPAGGKPVVLTLETIYSRIHPEERGQFKAAVESCINGATHFHSYHRQLNPGAAETWMHARGQAVFHPDGRVARVSGTAVDITDLMAAQQALRESESSLRGLTEAMPQIVWTGDGNGMITYFNQRWYEYTGATPKTSLGIGWLELTHAEDGPKLQANWDDALQHGTPYESEARFLRHDGLYRWHLNRAMPVRDSDGNVLRWIGTSTDIHDRKAADERAHVAEAQLRTILAHAPVILWAANRDGICTAVEGSALRDLPAHLRPYVGQSMLYDPARPEPGRQRLMRALAGETLNEEVTSGGRIYEAQYTPLFDTHGDVAGVIVFALDVTVRREAHRLARSEQQSKALAEARSEFLAQMSHEIRTPMNGVLGMVQLLLDSPLSSEQERHVRTLQASGRILMTIINDILDLSKLEAKTLTIQRVSFDLATLVQQQVELFANRAQEKNLPLRLRIDPELPSPLHGDPVRLGQIILNLLSNAIKFTEQGHVSVVVQQLQRDSTTSSVQVRVEDTGIGMNADGVARLFQPFSQVHDANQKGFGGTGLGLSIAKYLATLMDGELTVQSTLGLGSVFALTLPLSHINTDETPITPDAPLSSIHPRWLAGRRILVAEDNTVNQMVISSILRNLGAIAVVVDNGQKAIDAAGGEQFDAILMDCQMPVQDGFAATRSIRAAERDHQDGRHVPIVALTASAFLEDQRRCSEAGMDAFLAKPIDKQALEKQLSTWLAPAPAV